MTGLNTFGVISPSGVDSRQAVPHCAGTVRFTGISDDLQAEKDSFESKLQQEQERLKAQKRPKVLSGSLFRGNGRTVTGYEVLAVIQELGDAREYKAGTWAKRVGMGAVTALIVSSVVGLPVLIPLTMEGYLSRVFAKGILQSSMKTLFNPERSDSFAEGFIQLAELGLIQCRNTSRYNQDTWVWNITPLGREFLSAWQAGRAAETVQTGSAGNVQEKVLKPVSVPISSPEQRKARIRFLLNPQGGGKTGWELLQRFDAAEKNGSFLKRLKLIAGKGLSLQQLKTTVFQTLPEVNVPHRLKEMTDLGLLEMSGAGSRWRLSGAARGILEYRDPMKGLSVTSEDVQRLISDDIAELEARKAALSGELEALERKQGELMRNTVKLDAELLAAGTQALHMDEVRQGVTDTAQRKKQDRKLQEQLFQVQQLKQQQVFQREDAEFLAHRQSALEKHFQTWSVQANEAILHYNRALWQLKQAPDEQSLIRLMAEVSAVQEKLMLQQEAEAEPARENRSVTGPDSAAEAASDLLKAMDMDSQLNSLRAEVQVASGGMNNGTLRVEAQQNSYLTRKDA